MSAAGYQNLWAALMAPTEPAPERPPLGPNDPIAEWESPTQFFERVATPEPPARRRPAKGADDART